MNKPPARKLELLNGYDKKYILLVALVGSIIVLGSYFLFAGTSALARTAAFSVLAMIQIFVFVDLWLSHRSVFQFSRRTITPLFIIAFITPLILQFGIVSIPEVSMLFNITSVNFSTYLTFVLLSASVLPAIEVVKRVIRLRA
jgi:hypothetical protein